VLWDLLDEEEALDANDLCRRSGLGATDVAAALTSLEIDGYVRRIPGVGFTRC
jgi:DNA-binding GntR family transcriptional regulator